MKKTLIFGRVGKEMLPASLRRHFQVVTLRLPSERTLGDFDTGVLRLRDELGPTWNPRVFDLLNVMCVLRATDRFLVSEGLFRMQRSGAFAVGVTDLKHWQKLRQPITNVVTALSDDSLDFYPVELVRLPKLATARSDRPSGIGSESPPNPDCVCLFSGGADALAGAAHLLNHGRHPVFVSHGEGHIRQVQRNLFEALGRRFPQLARNCLVQVGTHPNTKKVKRESGKRQLYWRSRDQLQRLRSMFFLSLAGIVAQAIDVDEIFMCENGLIAAAIVFAPRYDNAFKTTRPAEPHYLRTMESFLRQSLDRPRLTIRNPFQYMTKGQVLSLATSLGFQSDLYRTISCWRSGNRGTGNCGRCVPCLFRQLAFDEAGLPKPPSKYVYQYPIPKKNWRTWRSQELERLEDIRKYCEEVAHGGVPWLMGNELAVIDAIDVTGGPPGEKSSHSASNRRDELAPAKVAEVVLRFARATLKRLP